MRVLPSNMFPLATVHTDDPNFDKVAGLNVDQVPCHGYVEDFTAYVARGSFLWGRCVRNGVRQAVSGVRGYREFQPTDGERVRPESADRFSTTNSVTKPSEIAWQSRRTSRFDRPIEAPPDTRSALPIDTASGREMSIPTTR